MASIASFATHDLESDVRSYVFSSCRSARMLILSASVARGSGSHFTAWHSCLSQQLHTPCLGQSHSTDLLDKEETKLQVWPPVSLILDSSKDLVFLCIAMWTWAWILEFSEPQTHSKSREHWAWFLDRCLACFVAAPHHEDICTLRVRRFNR